MICMTIIDEDVVFFWLGERCKSKNIVLNIDCFETFVGGMCEDMKFRHAGESGNISYYLEYPKYKTAS